MKWQQKLTDLRTAERYLGTCREAAESADLAHRAAEALVREAYRELLAAMPAGAPAEAIPWRHIVPGARHWAPRAGSKPEEVMFEMVDLARILGERVTIAFGSIDAVAWPGVTFETVHQNYLHAQQMHRGYPGVVPV